MMLSVVIVDDHPIVRAGLKTVLGSATDITVVAEGTSGQDALRLAAELNPDVLLLDLNLPDMDGAEVARRLCRQQNHIRILILTVQREFQYAFELLECGALGYLLKDEALETLASAVRAVARGENWLSPSIATQVVQRAVSKQAAAQSKQSSRSDPIKLTPRELEVLRLLALGLDNQSIADRLVLATRTVQNHVSNIYGKLGVSSRTEAALYAIQNGLGRVPQTNP